MAKLLNSKIKSKKPKIAEDVTESVAVEEVENAENEVEDVASVVASPTTATLKSVAQPLYDGFYNVKLGRQDLNELARHRVMLLLDATLGSVDKITITKISN